MGKRKKKVKQAVFVGVGLLASLIIMIPFLMIIINSMKDYKGANQLSLSLTNVSLEAAGQNYRKVWEEAKLLGSLGNSFLVTSVSVAFIVILAALASYTVVRRRTKAMKIVNNLMGLTLPLAMVPVYFMLTKVHMSSGYASYIGAVLVYTSSNFAFAYFLYTGFLKGISSEIDEAAIVDGASPLCLFFNIVFPLMKPVTVTVVISEVMTIWNDFNVALYLLNSSRRSTAVLTTYLFVGQKTSYWNLLFADVVLVSLPIILLYLVLQKYIVAGMSAGAIKG